jgi:hypothetical protein
MLPPNIREVRLEGGLGRSWRPLALGAPVLVYPTIAFLQSRRTAAMYGMPGLPPIIPSRIGLKSLIQVQGIGLQVK